MVRYTIKALCTSEASWTIGSLCTEPQTKEPKASRNSLCRQFTRPPKRQSRAWSMVKVAPHQVKMLMYKAALPIYVDIF